MFFTMDLRNHQITIGEVLNHPGARAMLTKKFPLIFKKQFSSAAKTVTLEQLLALVGGYLPQRMVADTLRELERL